MNTKTDSKVAGAEIVPMKADQWDALMVVSEEQTLKQRVLLAFAGSERDVLTNSAPEVMPYNDVPTTQSLQGARGFKKPEDPLGNARSYRSTTNLFGISRSDLIHFWNLGLIKVLDAPPMEGGVAPRLRVTLAEIFRVRRIAERIYPIWKASKEKNRTRRTLMEQGLRTPPEK